MILCLETATPLCAAALCLEGQVVAEVTLHTPQTHARLLTTLIDELLALTQTPRSALQAVACAAGPGSYTGLRIGTATAKGIALALDIPLLAVSTLEAWAAHALPLATALGAQVLPLMDAGRMEVYTATYGPDLACLKAPAAEIVDEAWVAALPPGPLLFLGDGAAKCAPLLHRPPHWLVWPQVPAAAGAMAVPAQRLLDAGLHASLPDFEPHYLKPVRLTTPRKLL
jgi:tRNA threonylcarbamoyladenosine biosynthesis protein TsaB